MSRLGSWLNCKSCKEQPCWGGKKYPQPIYIAQDAQKGAQERFNTLGGMILHPDETERLLRPSFFIKRFANEKAMVYNIAVKLSIGLCFTLAVVKLQSNAFSREVDSK